MPDDDADRRPYTYEDAARVCEVSPETIRARSRRGRLRKGKPTNSGRPTVLLSDAEIEAIRNGRPFRPDGQPPGRPDGQPSGQPSEFSSLVSQLEGRIAAHEAHIATLQDWLAAVEQRALNAEARAEKAEQRLIEELARLAGGLHPSAAPNTAALDQNEMDELVADLRSEFEVNTGPEPALDTRPNQPAAVEPSDAGAGRPGGHEAELGQEEGRGSSPPQARPLAPSLAAETSLVAESQESRGSASFSRRRWWRFWHRRL